MWKKALYTLPLLGFLGLAVYLFLNFFRADTYSSPLLDKPVPAFTLNKLPSKVCGLSNKTLQEGQVSIVSIFASWCMPCRINHDKIRELAEENLANFYGINYRDQPLDAQIWLARHGDPYKCIGMDVDGRASLEWGIRGVPVTFVVDKEGIIRYHHAGPLTGQEISAVLRPLLIRLRNS